MRAEALAALHGVELILHAGDVGGFSVLRELQRHRAGARGVSATWTIRRSGLPQQC